MLNDPKSSGSHARTEPPAGELEAANAVKRSGSGQLSVSIDEVSKTQSFKRDLQTLARIRQLAQTRSTRR